MRDLWMLRLPLIQDRYSASLPVVDENIDDEDGENTISERKLFSSQNEDEDDEEAGREYVRTTGKNRVYPSIVDTLALCYMGMMLLRLSVSICDIYRYRL